MSTTTDHTELILALIVARIPKMFQEVGEQLQPVFVC